MGIFSLKGRKALVTGGGKGIGKGISEGLLEAGAEVVLIGSSNSVNETADMFKEKGYSAYGVRGDLSDRNKLKETFEKSIEILGTIDILVNNAGVQKRCPAEDFPIEEWDRVLEMNLTAVFELCKLSFKIMKEKGSGKIINIASLNTFLTVRNIIAYASSKGGIGQLTKGLANEWAEYGININAIAPGFIATEMTAPLKDSKEKYDEIIKRIPAGKWGSPNELKGTAVYLASSASDYVNGVIIPVDGGFLTR